VQPHQHTKGHYYAPTNTRLDAIRCTHLRKWSENPHHQIPAHAHNDSDRIQICFSGFFRLRLLFLLVFYKTALEIGKQAFEDSITELNQPAELGSCCSSSHRSKRVFHTRAIETREEREKFGSFLSFFLFWVLFLSFLECEEIFHWWIAVRSNIFRLPTNLIKC
jgi:hypothetical protein